MSCIWRMQLHLTHAVAVEGCIWRICRMQLQWKDALQKITKFSNLPPYNHRHMQHLINHPEKLNLDFSGWPEAETKGERSGRRGELWQLVVGPVPGLAVERSRISLDLQTRRGRIVKGERFIWNMWSMIVTGEATNQEMSVPDCIYRLLLKSSRFRPCLWPGYILMQQNTACWRQQLAGMGIHGIRDPRKIHKGWSGALKKNVYKNLHISLFYLISFFLYISEN